MIELSVISVTLCESVSYILLVHLYFYRISQLIAYRLSLAFLPLHIFSQIIAN